MGEFTTSAEAQQEIREITNRFVDDVMLTSGQRELDRLGVDLQFNRLDPVIADTLEQYKSQLVETLIFGTGKEIADKVDLGMRHGASTDEIADDIRSLLQPEPETGRIPIEARAEMIARTEVALINEIGRLDAWTQSGVLVLVNPAKKWAKKMTNQLESMIRLQITMNESARSMFGLQQAVACRLHRCTQIADARWSKY